MTSKIKTKRNLNELSKDEIKHLDSLIGKVTYAFRGNSYLMGWDELKQEAWAKALEIIGSEDGRNEDGDIRYSYIKSAVRHLCIGLLRKSEIRKIEILTELYGNLEAVSSGFEADPVRVRESLKERENYGTDINFTEEGSSRKPLNFNEIPDETMIRDIKELFAQGSKERRYVELCSMYTAADERFDETFNGLFASGESMDIQISSIMGYESSTSSRFRKMRSRVRTTVAKYLGMKIPERGLYC